MLDINPVLWDVLVVTVRGRGRRKVGEWGWGESAHVCDGGVMNASYPLNSQGYTGMTNSLRNNSFDCFVEERKLVMLPRIKLLLGLVLNFIKWISEKRIHIHFRPKSWIIKRIYNCTQFSPQAQPAKISSVHVTGCFTFFSETERSDLNQVSLNSHRMQVWIIAWPSEKWMKNSTVLNEGSCRFLIIHKCFPHVVHSHLILDSDHNIIKIYY